MGIRGYAAGICAGLVFGILLLPAGTAPASASLRVADAGALQALVVKRPWSFGLEDRRDRPVLRERPGRGAGAPGTLGFRVGGKWRHVTRVRKAWRRGDLWQARLATTDHRRDLSVKVAPAGRGSIRLRARLIGPAENVTAIGMAFRAPPKERYLGFGERSDGIDQSGRVVENWVGEGPYQPAESEIVRDSFVPAWGLRIRDDATYFPMPWLLSTAGYGVLVENTAPSYFRLRTDRPDTWSLELDRDVDGLDQMPTDRPSPTAISLRFFAGPRPAGALRRMSAAIGRQPAPAPWFLGPWVQSKGGDQNTVEAIRSGDIPTSVTQTYTHYLPCASQLGKTEAERTRTSLFHAAGMAVTTYFNPMICTSYQPLFDELGAEGQLTRDRSGIPYEYGYVQFEVGQFDFSSPAARESYGELLDEALGNGYDGWMEDFGEYAPPDGVSADGTPGMVLHNRYPRDYHCAADRQTRHHPGPVLRFIRSGYTGAAACAPAVWGGDPSSDWGFDGLQSAVRNGLSMGLSGVGVWGSDIGGFFTLASPPLSPELLARWIQFGAFSGVMRNQANGFQVGGGRAQIFDPDQVGNWRRYAKLRTQLYPYVRAAAAGYRHTGMPVMRALALTHPGDARAVAQEDQYMFGPDLMVAPVLGPGERSREVYLPRGKWVDLWRSLDYEAGPGSFVVRGARVVKGRQLKRVAAPLDQIPLLARAGSLLPMLPAGVDTLAPFGSKDESIVHLTDRAGRRELLAFPRGMSKARFEKGGRLISREGRGRWTLRIEDWRRRSWRIEASLGAMKRPFTVRCVWFDGKPLDGGAWSFRSEGRVLAVNLPPDRRSGRMTASARRCGR